MKKQFCDTNIFLRYLTADDKAKYSKCRALFEKVVDGKITLFTSDLVIAEVIWTLQSYYKVPKDEVIEKVATILNTPNIKVENFTILAEALLLYSMKNIDFIDAYNSSYMQNYAVDEIYSYDKDFDRIESLTRIEP